VDCETACDLIAELDVMSVASRQTVCLCSQLSILGLYLFRLIAQRKAAYLVCVHAV